MQRNPSIRLLFWVLALSSAALFTSSVARSQDVASPASADSAADVKSLAASVLQLQSQIQMLNAQMSELRTAQQQAVRDSQELRAELNRTREQLTGRNGEAYAAYAPAATPLPATPPSPMPPSPTQPPTKQPNATQSYGNPQTLSPSVLPLGAASPASATQAEGSSLDARVAQLEGDVNLMNDKITEQSQTKVESGSKYRVRFSGIILLNTEITRGSVDNLDFPQIATPPTTPGTSGAFSGSLRQSQLGVEAFGPDIAGARTSANVTFDFAGGFPNAPNGVAFGVVRLRTGDIRLDWENTSIVAGQDPLFFAPLTPTTLTSLATPALSYSGNLWSWTPQIRIEHRIALSDNSRLVMQAGILDSLTGDIPPGYYRTPTAGEQSGQPAYAAHLSWARKMFGRELVIGFGGYYGRQNWGFGRNVDGWAGTTDVTVPLGAYFDVTGEFYRGRAVGGLGGAIGQTILLSGPIADPATEIQGLDSLGGWVQLKYKPVANFEVNLAYGQDNPFAGELRMYPASASYYGYLLSRNQSPFVNFIYRVRSDVLFSVEYRRLQTYPLYRNLYIANQTTMSLGYLF
jgi:cell division protein FtsB